MMSTTSSWLPTSTMVFPKTLNMFLVICPYLIQSQRFCIFILLNLSSSFKLTLLMLVSHINQEASWLRHFQSIFFLNVFEMMFILDPWSSGLHFSIHMWTTNNFFSKYFVYVLDFTSMNNFFWSWFYLPMNSPISSSFDDKFVITLPTLFQFQVCNIGYTRLPKFLTKHHFVEGIKFGSDWANWFDYFKMVMPRVCIGWYMLGAFKPCIVPFLQIDSCFVIFASSNAFICILGRVCPTNRKFSTNYIGEMVTN